MPVESRLFVRRPAKHHEFVWGGHGEGVKQYAIYQAENGRVCADAQRQRQNRSHRESRVLEQHAEPVLQILEEIFEPAPTPGVSRELFHQTHIPEFSPGSGLRFVVGRSSLDAFRFCHLQMVLDFLLQLVASLAPVPPVLHGWFSFFAGFRISGNRCLSSLPHPHYVSTPLSFSFPLTHTSAPPPDPRAWPAAPARRTPAASLRATARSLQRRSAGPRPSRQTTYLSRSALAPGQEAVRLPRRRAPAAFLVSAQVAVHRSVRRQAPSGFQSPACAVPPRKKSVRTIRCTPAAAPARRTHLKHALPAVR